MKSLLSTLPVLALFLLGTLPATHADSYPLTTCVVSGEKLDDMGKPVVIHYKGTEVRFCCNDCVGKFQKDPDKYLARLKSATAAH